LCSITESGLGGFSVGIISIVYLVVRCLLGCLMVLAWREVPKDTNHPLPEALRRPSGLSAPAPCRRLTRIPRNGLTLYSVAANLLAFERSVGRPPHS
jgi:hypothetical protein